MSSCIAVVIYSKWFCIGEIFFYTEKKLVLLEKVFVIQVKTSEIMELFGSITNKICNLKMIITILIPKYQVSF